VETLGNFIPVLARFSAAVVRKSETSGQFRFPNHGAGSHTERFEDHPVNDFAEAFSGYLLQNALQVEEAFPGILEFGTGLEFRNQLRGWVVTPVWEPRVVA
jgi:hypothetical protein